MSCADCEAVIGSNAEHNSEDLYPLFVPTIVNFIVSLLQTCHDMLFLYFLLFLAKPANTTKEQ